MKKKILSVVLTVVLLFSLTGCGEQAQVDLLKQEISELQEKKTDLQNEVSELENITVENKEENGTAKYVLTLEIKQSHFPLDISCLNHFQKLQLFFRFSSIEPMCEAESIPIARPLIIVIPTFESSFANEEATFLPYSKQSLEPTIARIFSLFSNFTSPTTYKISGASFLFSKRLG